MRQGYKRGLFKEKEISLSLQGSYTFKQISLFKKELEVLGQITGLKERKFSPQKIVFQVDSSLSSRQLFQLIKKKKFKSFRITSFYYNPKSIEVSLRFN